MRLAGALSPVVAAAVLGYVIWGQLRRRRFSVRLTLPLVLIVLGAVRLAAFARLHPLGTAAAAILAASLVFDAVGLAAARAFTVRLWVEEGSLWRQGNWVTAALWLAGAGGHAALDAAAGTGSASYLLYLGVTLLAQRLVLQARTRHGTGVPARPRRRRTRHWLGLGLFCILGLVGGLAAFFGAAFLFRVPAVLVGVACSLSFLIAFAGARLEARPLQWGRPGRAAVMVGLGTTLVLGVVFSVTLLAPWPSSAVARRNPPVPDGVRYWHLRTGSRIAYLEVPARGVANPAPIVFVGGGPGEEDVANASQVRFFGQLAQVGYDVYFYDQVGSGLSARLANPAQYTLARAVADLEAIREQIGAQQIVLMGSSWGGTLVANYMASYPEHVVKAVFTSPAPIDYYEWHAQDDDIMSALPPALQSQASRMLTGSPRFLSWYILGEINPQAAHNLVPDAEADAFFNTFLQTVARGTVCDASHLPSQPEQGDGFYDNMFTVRSAKIRHPGVNPRDVLAADHTPVLIMTGSCNYVKWPVEWQYKATFPDATLLYFPRAGHAIYLDQPRLYLQSIEAFLTGKPLPIHPWTSPQPPASVEH